MFFSSEKIIELVKKGEIGIEPFEQKNLKGASYTFTLGSKLKLLKKKDCLDSREDPEFNEIEISPEGYELKPGEFVILYTREKVTLHGKYLCLLSTRATIAQMGLDVTQGSFLCEPDTDNTFALETSNHGPLPIRLFPGTKIVKGIFTLVI